MEPVPLTTLFEHTLAAVAMLDGHASTLLAIFRGETGCDIQLIARMRSLVEEVEEGGERCVQHLIDLAGKVETTETELSAAGEAATAALRNVADAAPTVANSAHAMDTDTLEKSVEIENERAAADTLLQDGMSNAREDVARALEAAEMLAAVLSTRIEETRRSMAELREAVQEATADLAAASQRFLDAAAEVDRTCTADGVAYRAGIDALMQEGASQLTSLANQTLGEHNGTLGPLRQRLTGDEPNALHEMITAVIAAMEPILERCAERANQLVQAAEECEPLAEEGSSTVDRIAELTRFALTI